MPRLHWLEETLESGLGVLLELRLHPSLELDPDALQLNQQERH